MKLLLPLLILSSLFVVGNMDAENAEAKTKTTDNITFEYPNNWKSEKLDRFTNIEARLVYGANDVQMNFETGNRTDYFILGEDSFDTEMLETLSASLFNDGDTFESGTDKYIINNHTAPYAITTYETEPSLFGGTLDMVGMAVIVHLSEDKIALVQYVAEQEDFDKYLPKVEKVLQSIKPVDSVSETETETETDNSFTSRGDDLQNTRALCDTVTIQSGKDLCETLLN